MFLRLCTFGTLLCCIRSDNLGHTTAATIRKRKERIRKKLPTELYEVIAKA